MPEGLIVKAISGFYYVKTGDETVECRARGRFRLDGSSPLVGDRVVFSRDAQGKGRVDGFCTKKFFNPSGPWRNRCSGTDASEINPITDPFLIDRVTSIAEHNGCRVVICINKSDICRSDRLFDIYSKTGYKVIRTSAVTGEGIRELCAELEGKVCAFSGDSGVGKSSLLNAIAPELCIETGEVSEKLGRGRHTTRHVELFSVGGALLADTPGFASFDVEMMQPVSKTELQYTFPEFVPYIGRCRFDDCAHLKEPECAVTAAVHAGTISASRYGSYVRLYEISAQYKSWEK
jgi:ribosome biogenesis GTPase